MTLGVRIQVSSSRILRLGRSGHGSIVDRTRIRCWANLIRGRQIGIIAQQQGAADASCSAVSGRRWRESEASDEPSVPSSILRCRRAGSMGVAPPSDVTSIAPEKRKNQNTISLSADASDPTPGCGVVAASPITSRDVLEIAHGQMILLIFRALLRDRLSCIWQGTYP